MMSATVARQVLGPLNSTFGALGVVGALLFILESTPSKLMRDHGYAEMADSENTLRLLKETVRESRPASRSARASPEGDEGLVSVRQRVSRLWLSALVLGSIQVLVSALLAASGVLLSIGARPARSLSMGALALIPASSLAHIPFIGTPAIPNWDTVICTLQGVRSFHPASGLAWTVSLLALLWTFAYPVAGILVLRYSHWPRWTTVPDIAQFLKDDEGIRWRGAPDRDLYLAFIRRFYRVVNAGGFVLNIGVGYLVLRGLPPVARLAAAVVVASLVIAAGMFGQSCRVRRTRYLGQYAIADTRVLCLGMRGGLREMPIDSDIRYRIVDRERSGTVEFRHPRFRPFRFGCLAQSDMASLLEVLPLIREATP